MLNRYIGTETSQDNGIPQHLRWLSNLPVIFLGASLLLTLVLWKMYDKSLLEQSRLIYADRIGDISSRINERMLGHQQMLRGAAALFSIKDDVSRADWRQYVAALHLEERHPDLQSIGFSKLLTPAERDANIRKIRAEGFPEYTIHPAGARPAYSSVIYIEPFDWRNQRAFGYDMCTETIRKAAMEMARDENVTTIAAKIILIQENGTNTQSGFLMYVPVYRKGMKLDSVTERRAACIGFAYSAVRMNNFVSYVISKLPQDIAFDISIGNYITGKPTAGNLMYSSIQAGKTILPDNYTPAITTTQTIEAYGCSWHFTFKTLSGFTKELNRTQSYLFLLGGISFSVVASFLILELLSSRDRRIKHTERLLSNLSDRHAIAMDSAAIGVWEWLVAENKLIWNHWMFALYGLKMDDFSGAYQAWQSGLHPDDKVRGDLEINLALQGEKEFDTEFRVIWPSGEVRHIKAKGYVVRDVNGKPLRMIGVNFDITEQKLAEQKVYDAQEFTRSTLDGLSLHICVLNVQGDIITTNSAWDYFAIANNAAEGKCCKSVNYLDVCQNASEHGDTEAESFHAGISAVLHGALPIFIKEYSCHSPDKKRWFVCRANPFILNGARYAVISHENITERKETAGELYKLSLAVKQSPVCIVITNTKGVIEFVNPAFTQMTGYSAEEAIGLYTRVLKSGQTLPETYKKLWSTIMSGEPWEGNLLNKCKDGRLFWEHCNISVIRDELGDITHYLASKVNITEQKQLEAKAKEALEYAENIVEAVREPLMVLDSDLKVLSANRSFYETFAVNPVDTIHQYLYDLGNKQWNIPAFRTLLEDILPNDTVINGYEVEYVFPGIGRKTIVLNARQIFRGTLASHIILLAMEDISVRKTVAEKLQYAMDEITAQNEQLQYQQIELKLQADDLALIANERKRELFRISEQKQELAESNRRLEDASRIKSDFLANMSHELRTPLNAVIGFSDVLQCQNFGVINEKQAKYLSYITSSGKHLLTLINDILDISKVESGKMPFTISGFSLRKILNYSFNTLRAKAQEGELSLQLELEPQTDVHIVADETKLTQIIFNLLSNAIKFTPAGGTVEMRVIRAAESFEFRVTDSGIGIKEEDIPKLFQPFSQLESAYSKKNHGTGLGLALSRQLVEMHGGTIWVESEFGTGSRFIFTIPQAQISKEACPRELPLLGANEEPAAGDNNEKREELIPESSENTSIHAGWVKPHKILIVEDNKVNLALIEAILAGKGFDVFSADDGQKGVALAREVLPDLILMDIQMPVMDGVEACKVLKGYPETSGIKIVALTSFAMQGDRKKIMMAGFDEYMSKPVASSDLLSLLKQMLNSDL